MKWHFTPTGEPDLLDKGAPSGSTQLGCAQNKVYWGTGTDSSGGRLDGSPAGAELQEALHQRLHKYIPLQDYIPELSPGQALDFSMPLEATDLFCSDLADSIQKKIFGHGSLSGTEVGLLGEQIANKRLYWVLDSSGLASQVKPVPIILLMHALWFAFYTSPTPPSRQTAVTNMICVTIFFSLCPGDTGEYMGTTQDGQCLFILSIFCTGMIDARDSEDEDPSDMRLKDRRTPRIALCRHCQSSFIYLFNSGNEQALLNCGVDHKVFRDLLHLFQPLTLTKNEVPKGRKQEANAACCLGLVLFWFCTRGSVARISSMGFGLTSTAMITLPNKVETEEYISAIGAKYPALHEKQVWSAANGLKLLIQHSDNWLIQSQYYSSWTCNTYMSSVFVFAPDGRIRITAFKCPGSWHDSNVADYSVYDQMQETFDECGAMLTVNAAFKVILNVMMLLYNYQISTVGHNQILNVFMHKKDGYFSYDTGPT
eukprot:jgi/Psemu1/3738/gm1.3738_g